MNIKFASSLVLLSISFFITQAQSNFRSNGTGGGSWTTISTWQVESPNGSNNWIAASSTPTSASGTIQIRSGDVVTVSSNLSIDQAIVDVGGTLDVSANTLTLVNTASALTVNGTLSASATGQVADFGANNLTINGTYTHARNSGSIPLATWNSGSDCTVTGATSTAPSGLNPPGGFYRFTWNCPGQTGIMYFGGNLTSVANNLTITTTNGQQVLFASSAAGSPMTIGGNLQVDGDSRIGFVTSGVGAVINVTGDFNYNSTNATGSQLKTTGTYTLNVTGNFNMNATGGTLNLSGGLGTTGTFNLNGNVTITAGTLTTAAGRGAVNFNKAGTQSFTNNGTISGFTDFTIAAGSTLDMLAESPFAGQGNLVVNGTLRLGSTHATGALLNGGTGLGNIRNTPANRTYNSGAKIVYGGTGAQVIGSGHPNISGVITEIDNTSGVSFNTSASGNSGTNVLSIADNLILTNGTLNITGTSSLPRTLTINANVTATSGNVTFGGSYANLTINGTGDLGLFPTPIAGTSLQNLTLNRTSSGSVTFNKLTILGTVTLTNGTATFGGATSIAGSVSLASGTVMAFDNQSLTMTGNFTSTGGLLSASGTSTLSLSGTTALTSSLNFLAGHNTLSDLTINYTNASGTSVQIGSSTLNITNSLTLTHGFLDIANALNMSSGSTINFNASGTQASAITTNSPSGGPWNLNYTGSLNVTTGLELPASGSVLGLSSSNTATITLDQILAVGANGISMSAGNIKCGANNVSSSSLTISGGTFTAPSTTLTLTGNVSIAGTYTANSGIVAFTGNSTLSGSNIAATNFDFVTISGTLTPSSILNVRRNFVNNGSFVPGTSTVNLTSTAATQTISGSTNTQFYNLTVNKASGSVTVSSPETVTNNLTITLGNLSVSATLSVSGTVVLTASSLVNNSSLLTMSNGSSIIRAGGTITTTRPSGGPWNLTYTGASKTTAFEIPSSGNLTSLTVSTNSSTTVTLAAAQPLNVTGALTVNSGNTFISGSNNVAVGSLSNNGTFNAPSSAATTGLTLNGTLTNSGTFNAGTGTVVIGGNVSFSGTVPTLNKLTISATGTLNLPAALTVQSDFQNNGTFTAGSGTFTFAGNTAKTITGTSKTIFNNLTVSDGTSGTDLSLETAAGADLKGILTMSGASVFDTDGAANNKVFTLLSTSEKPTVDASVAPLSSSAQLPGKITVQRYLNKIGVANYNYQVWRNISSPVNTMVSDMQTSLPVTGPFAHASTVSGADASASSIETYDETVVTDTNGDAVNDINDGWGDYPLATGDTQTSPFVRGVGYSMFIYGSDPPVSTNNRESWSLSGVIWSGTFNLPVTFSSSGDVTSDGWNLIGNPYPSTIDWNSANWTKTNIDNAIYMDDYNAVQPKVASYVNGVSTNGGSNLIATGQGFWVKANAASPVLTIQETVKAAGSQTTYFREAAPDNLMRVNLVKGGVSDETVIYFKETSTNNFDTEFDAIKFRNRQIHNLSSMADGKEKYSINSMAPIKGEKEVALDISSVVNGTYQLTFSGIGSFQGQMNIQLRDNYTKSIIDLRKKNSYSFDIDKNNRATFGSYRFTIIFGGNEEPSVVAESLVRVYPNPVAGTLTVEVPGEEATGEILNMMGSNIDALNFTSQGQNQVAHYNFDKAGGGVYFVKVISNGKVTVTRVIKE